MSRTYAVPTRVREHSPNPIGDLASWRRAWLMVRDDPDAFWLYTTQKNIEWRRPPTRGLEGDFRSVREDPLRWFADGELNVTESCLDRHVAEQPGRTAILWEGDEPGDVRRLSYSELLEQVCRCAGALSKLGVQKGDRVIIYMGMVPEAAVAMLACARLGAVHSVVFGGFSAEALRDRIRDCDAEVLITQDEGLRGGRTIPLKATADAALEGERGVRFSLVLRRTGAEVPWVEGRDIDWHDALALAPSRCAAEVMAAEDPLFILYTSGSTGKPKGLVHTCGGYITWAAWTHRTVFDLRSDDVFGCVADVGWITGHTYIVYGPLANGTTTLMFESTPVYPDAGRYWDLVQRHRLTVLYTAPTAIRTLAAAGDRWVTSYDRSSLRVLGTVGEPINPEAWAWYHDVVGEGRCAVVDTWWQTETGGICISPVAPATPTRPGSATLPLPGIEPLIVDAESQPIRGPGSGDLCIAQPWPGQARTVWGDHTRFVATYFAAHPGLYFTGDGCRRDADGYHWITGRVDDVLNVAGHRMGTAEFESAILARDEVAECAVVGFPHPVKGQGVFAFIVLQPETEEEHEEIFPLLNQTVRGQIGAHAKVDHFQVIPGLPKTRSGKLMRRLLRKVVHGEADQLGDTSTLADPSVVPAIIAGFRGI